MRRTNKKVKKSKHLSLKLIYLLLITLLIFSFSMARYKTTYEGDIQGDVAKWVFKIDGNSQNNFTINLGDTVEQTTKFSYQKAVLAPSAKGSFDIVMDCTDCDVAIEYEIIITPNQSSVIPRGLVFYSDELNATRTSILNERISGIISLQDVKTIKTIPITIDWNWELNTENPESNFEGEQLLVDVTVVGKQYL